MDIGDAFIILAAVLLLFDLSLLMRAGTRKRFEAAFLASSLACVLVVAAYFRLTMAFIHDAFWLEEVYTYSSSSLALPYKIGDPWIGSSGSMLFIAFIFSILYFIYRIRVLGRERRFNIAASRILDIFLFFILVLTILKSPFELLPMNLPDGAGLNPLLQTFWVLVHPPVVFIGYVLVFFACAFMLAGLATGEREGEEELNSIILYSAWLFLAFGIALGGWWSYEVLGWGGYWAWDPVETASLVPWLALTAYFHLPGKSKDMMRELTLMITFFMVIFATALTRGGLLESVHAFGKSPVGPALLIFALGVVLYFFYLALRTGTERARPIYSPEVDISSLSSISLFVAFWSLMFLMIICFLGDLAPIIGGALGGAPMSTTPEFYNRWCYPFTLVFVAALMGCSMSMKVKRFIWSIASIAAIGVILVLLRVPTPNWMANFGLPLLLAAGFAIAYYLGSALCTKGGRQSPYIWGKTLIHIAIIIILIGVFVSSTAQTESRGIIVKPNSTVDMLGAKITLGTPTIYPGRGHVYASTGHFFTMPEYSSLALDVSIVDGTTVYTNKSLRMYYYTNYGILSKPLIISTLRGDLYIFMEHTNSSYNSLFYALMGEKRQPADFRIKVKRVPLIWLVWSGVILLAAGMVILICNEAHKSR